MTSVTKQKPKNFVRPKQKAAAAATDTRQTRSTEDNKTEVKTRSKIPNKASTRKTATKKVEPVTKTKTKGTKKKEENNKDEPETQEKVEPVSKTTKETKKRKKAEKSESEETSPEKKKPKKESKSKAKVIDKNAPLEAKPAKSYFIFDMKNKIAEESKLQGRELTKELNKAWTECKNKSKYYQMEEEDERRYQKELIAYEVLKPKPEEEEDTPKASQRIVQENQEPKQEATAESFLKTSEEQGDQIPSESKSNASQQEEKSVQEEKSAQEEITIEIQVETKQQQDGQQEINDLDNGEKTDIALTLPCQSDVIEMDVEANSQVDALIKESWKGTDENAPQTLPSIANEE